MNRTGIYLGNITKAGRAVLIGLAVLFVSAGIAQATAATTIGTNILTTGTLGVTGLSTFGNASSTLLSANYAQFGGTATSTFNTDGTVGFQGALSGTSATFSSSLSVTGTLTTSGLVRIAPAYSIDTSSAGVLNIGTTTATTINIGRSGQTVALEGSATVVQDLTLLNAQAATSTATVGCVVTTATSSATKIVLRFNTSATSTSINGGTVQGVVLWGYGSACN